MSKVMVEVGDLEKLKKAIATFAPWVADGIEETGTLVALAQRVVAEEERIQGLIDAPADIDSSF